MPSTLLDIFDHVRVINLKERTDRLKFISLELVRVGSPIDNARVSRFDAIRPADKGKFETLGTRGCFMSHLGVLHDAMNKIDPQSAPVAAGSVLILEDDLGFHSRMSDASYIDHLAASLRNTPDWGIFYLGHYEKDFDHKQTDLPKLKLLPPDRGIIGAHFYAVSSIALPRLHDFSNQMLHRPPGDPKGGPMPWDGAISTFRKLNPDILTLILTPSVGTQRSSPSDITPSKWDQSGLGPALRLFRWFKRRHEIGN